MSLCINPRCPQPDHSSNATHQFCQGCGSDLILQGRYRVMRLLSDNSGFGKVYEAYERSTPKILKVLKESLNNNAKAVQLFEKEATVLSQLHHLSIPRVDPDGYFLYYPKNRTEPLRCLLMEKIDGPNLKQWMHQQGNHPISEKQALNWLHQLTTVLHLVHQKNYFHRDIKPENIMLRPTGQLVLVDFGAAREITQTYLEHLGSAEGVTALSSAGYTPPEQEHGQAVPQSDFYALGRTIIYLLTAKFPTDRGIYDSLKNTFNWRIHATDLSPEFADLIDQMIASRAIDRPKDTQEILDKLAAIASQQSAFTSPINRNLATAPQTAMPAATFQDAQVKSTSLQLNQPTVQTTAFKPGKPSKLILGLGGLILLAMGFGSYTAWSQYQQTIRQASDQIVASSNAQTQEVSLAKTLLGHSNSINDFVLSAGGNTLISASGDKTIRLWDLSKAEEIGVLKGNKSFINVLTLSFDGQTLISGGADGVIKIWSLETRQEIQSWIAHSSAVNALAKSPDGKYLFSGAADGGIKIWTLSTGEELRTLVGHPSAINALAASDDGQTLFSGSADKTIKRWNIQTGKKLQTFSGHTSYINALLMSRDGQFLFSASADKTIKQWNLSTGEAVNSFTGHSGFVNALDISPDGQWLRSSSADQTIRVWDVQTGGLLNTYTGFGSHVEKFILWRDGQIITANSENNTIGVWRSSSPPLSQD